MQPREGGCCSSTSIFQVDFCFNTQKTSLTAARRRLHCKNDFHALDTLVSTHSRAEAVELFDRTFHESQQCFNTQPPEGGCAHYVLQKAGFTPVSTHSRPKAAAQLQSIHDDIIKRFNTQPPEGGCRRQIKSLPYRNLFQHTAARRRLLLVIPTTVG